MVNIYEISKRIRDSGGDFSASKLEELFGKYEGRFDDLLDVEGLLEKIVKDLTEEDIFSKEFRIRDYCNKDSDFSKPSNGINVIPSNKNEGVCAKECITIFSRPLRASTSTNLKSPFIQLINYWISCIQINEENLILINGTGSGADIDIVLKNLITLSSTYSKVHSKQVFIVLITKTGFEIVFKYGKIEMDANKYNL